MGITAGKVEEGVVTAMGMGMGMVVLMETGALMKVTMVMNEAAIRTMLGVERPQ
ncbi:hypothetical protein [Paraburkholderia sp. C35]|uniref:hypothetical protein n=1 Tax=Paraburkholderia sp. C35 TaxID=2126993 RepID=UPI001EF61409|nr:hypothetical protein [Paraburkholderia sp. C35]